MPAPSRRELWGANLSTLDCCYGEVPAVESLSQKSKIFDSSHRPGALRPVAADNAHGSFLLLVTSLTRPVSFYGAIPGFFVLSIDSVGRKRPETYRPKRGQGLKPSTPSQSEGSIPVGSTRGILKGGTIRAGASCSPLKPASLHTFLPEQESMAPLASACRKPIEEENKGF